MIWRVPTALVVVVATVSPGTRADEISTADKLRMLYSSSLGFTDDRTPLIRIEIASGREVVELSAESGLVVLPDGAGGSEIEAGGDWTVRARGSRPARVLEWTVVARFLPGQEQESRRELARWRGRGQVARQFEVGTVFGVEGKLIDSRRLLVAVSPVLAPNGAAQAADLQRIYGAATEVHPEIERLPAGTIVATDGRTTVRNASVLWFAPRRADDTVIVKDVLAGHGGSQLELRRESRRYFGSVYVTIGSDGRLTAVNAVPIDRLLAGLVPAEMFAEAPQEALAAQAIAARTELLHKIGSRHIADPYDLCSNQHCQVYGGAGREHDETTRAVRRTRGLVMLGRGESGLIDARYSASCGGHGEHNEAIWGSPADSSLRGRFDGPEQSRAYRRFAGGVNETNIAEFLALPPQTFYDGATPWSRGRLRWTRRIDAAELGARIAKAYPEIGGLIDLVPHRRSISGRAIELRLRGTRGETIARGDLHIRRLLGGLKSTLFTVQVLGDRHTPDAFIFRGAGYGHGVGMCQLGAVGLAQQGKTYKVILRHYYRNSVIRRLY